MLIAFWFYPEVQTKWNHWFLGCCWNKLGTFLFTGSHTLVRNIISCSHAKVLGLFYSK